MNTLIIPCAGKSSRFPNMNPKFMLIHPDGKLMIEKSIEKINTDVFERIVIVIAKPHDEMYCAKSILEKAFENNKKVEVCVLDDFTSSVCETVYLALQKMNITNAIVVKDSDNSVKINFDKKIKNMTVGYNLTEHKDVSNISEKSFLILNEQNLLMDIVEKQVVSNVICLGTYCFESSDIFAAAYKEMLAKKIPGEMYISHLISYLLSDNKYVFQAVMAEEYSDWGTLSEWKKELKKYRTYFIDYDGLLEEKPAAADDAKVFLEKNIKILAALQKEGAQIVILTNKAEKFRLEIKQKLSKYGLKPYEILTGMNLSSKVLINSFTYNHPHSSCIAVSMSANSEINDCLEDVF